MRGNVVIVSEDEGAALLERAKPCMPDWLNGALRWGLLAGVPLSIVLTAIGYGIFINGEGYGQSKDKALEIGAIATTSIVLPMCCFFGAMLNRPSRAENPHEMRPLLEQNGPV